jgi:4'-phosphopantetheinyl transferase
MASEGIELYIGLLDGIDSLQCYADCYTTLSEEERARAGQFLLDHQRRQYIFAHGLLRFALSNFTFQAAAPSDWSFVTDRYGRPFVAAPATSSPVYFSLSHTEGCVTCAVSDCERVGVDVERIQERGSLWEIARSAFSVNEIEALRGLPPSDFIDRFFDYWTLKEAYLKARGRGLSLPLDQFSILISLDEIAIKLMPGMDVDSERWHFTKRSPSANHRMAIADGSGAAGGLPMVVRHWPVARLA